MAQVSEQDGWMDGELKQLQTRVQDNHSLL